MTRIEFSVENRPPRKYRNNSLWSSDSEAPLVKKLRECAINARKNTGLNEHFSCPVKIELIVYSSNIASINDSYNYVGDLDAFVSGICESLQPADKQAHIHEIFVVNEDSYPTKPILFLDDSQVIEINARKVKSENTSYTLSIEDIK